MVFNNFLVLKSFTTITWCNGAWKFLQVAGPHFRPFTMEVFTQRPQIALYWPSVPLDRIHDEPNREYRKDRKMFWSYIKRLHKFWCWISGGRESSFGERTSSHILLQSGVFWRPFPEGREERFDQRRFFWASKQRLWVLRQSRCHKCWRYFWPTSRDIQHPWRNKKEVKIREYEKLGKLVQGSSLKFYKKMWRISKGFKTRFILKSEPKR